MKEINNDFNVPYYIFEEITEYIEQTAQGRRKCSKWENIKSLLILAKANNKLNDEQVTFIIDKFNRE